MEALRVVLDPSRILYIFLGVAIGAFIGVIPGLGGTVGMAIVLPFVFGMDPFTGMALLIGMIAVIHTADTFPSVLLGIPGSAGSQATIVDGYPLAKKGEAARALGASFTASLLGGLIGGIALFLAIQIARPLILSFGSPELLMLSLLGLSMVGVLTGKNPKLGIGAGLFGLLLGSVGAAPSVTEYRYSFDILYLQSGIPLPILALGLFAFPVMVDLVAEKQGSIAKEAKIGSGIFKGVKETFQHKFLVFRSAVLGAIIGFVPGLGGSVVDWISYGLAKQTEKNTENFGKGDIRGVIAPESSNNAKEGGGLIPTLLFGIPGSGTTAMLLGGLTLMGVQAGPRMLDQDLDLTMSIIWTLILANIIGAIACIFLAKYISKVALVQAEILVPILLVILTIGAYQSTRHWGDIILFFAIGIIGWFMSRLGWSRAAVLIGFVLATPIERYLWISISRYGSGWLTNPGVIIIGILITLIVIGSIVMARREKAKGGPTIG
nr:tripartite tricarboxylate transporter permease [Oceanobacillus saliphilus]